MSSLPSGSGSAACSRAATRSRRRPTASDALDLITSVGDFDVAIVELALAANGEALPGMPAIRALRKARPALGIVAHGARPGAPCGHRGDRRRGDSPTSPRARPPSVLETAVDAAAEAEHFVDPAARRNGHCELTRRQRQILQLYADGHSTENAAQRLGLSTETVRTHTKAVLVAPRRPRPRPRGRDRPPLRPDRVAPGSPHAGRGAHEDVRGVAADH